MKKLLFMKSGMSFETATGILFSKEHPYHLVDEEDAISLLTLTPERFDEASKIDVKNFYNLKEDLINVDFS
jgi:uncharacterized protein YwqG